MNIKDQIIQNFVSELKSKATIPELLFKDRLDSFGIRYSFQHPILYKNTFIICDFCISSIKLIIEIDGGYHLKLEQREKDRDRDLFLSEKGYTVFRILNKDVEKYDIHNITNRFKRVIPKKKKIKVLPNKNELEIKAKRKELIKSKRKAIILREKILRLQYPYLFI